MRLTITKSANQADMTPLQLTVALGLDESTAVGDVVSSGEFLDKLRIKIKEIISVKFYKINFSKKSNLITLNFYHGDLEKNDSLGSIQFDTEAKTATIKGFQLEHFKNKNDLANSQIESILRTTMEEYEEKKNTTNNDAHIPSEQPAIDIDNSSTPREKNDGLHDSNQAGPSSSNSASASASASAKTNSQPAQENTTQHLAEVAASPSSTTPQNTVAEQSHNSTSTPAQSVSEENNSNNNNQVNLTVTRSTNQAKASTGTGLFNSIRNFFNKPRMEDSTKSRVDPTLPNPTANNEVHSDRDDSADAQVDNSDLDAVPLAGTLSDQNHGGDDNLVGTNASDSDDDSMSRVSVDSHLSNSSNSAPNLPDNNNDSDSDNRNTNQPGSPAAPTSQKDPEDPNEKIVKATYAKFLGLQENQVQLAINQENSSTNTDGNAASSSTDPAPTQTQATGTTLDAGKKYSVTNPNTQNGITAGTITIKDLPSTSNGKNYETKQEVTFEGFKKNINQNNTDGEDADLDAALFYLEEQAKTLKRGDTLKVSDLTPEDLKKLSGAIEEDKKKGKNKNYETLSKLFDSKNGNTIKFHNPTFWELIKAFFAKIGNYIKENPKRTAGIILFTALAIGLILTGVGAIPVGLALGTALIPAVKMTVGGLFISSGISCALVALGMIAKPLLTKWRERKAAETPAKPLDNSNQTTKGAAP